MTRLYKHIPTYIYSLLSLSLASFLLHTTTTIPFMNNKIIINLSRRKKTLPPNYSLYYIIDDEDPKTVSYICNTYILLLCISVIIIPAVSYKMIDSYVYDFGGNVTSKRIKQELPEKKFQT